MVAMTAERVMGRKKTPEKNKRDDAVAKIDRTVLDKAKLVASRKGVSLAEYLTDHLRATVEREFGKTVREMEGDKS